MKEIIIILVLLFIIAACGRPYEAHDCVTATITKSIPEPYASPVSVPSPYPSSVPSPIPSAVASPVIAHVLLAGVYSTQGRHAVTFSISTDGKIKVLQHDNERDEDEDNRDSDY